MNFTIPATKYTKAIIVCVHGKLPSGGWGAVIAFVSELNKSTKGDECLFFNKHGISSHILGK